MANGSTDRFSSTLTALLLSPDENPLVQKLHLCVDGWTGLDCTNSPGDSNVSQLPSSGEDAAAHAASRLAAGLRGSFVTALVDGNLVVDTNTPLQVLRSRGSVQEQIQLLRTLANRLL